MGGRLGESHGLHGCTGVLAHSSREATDSVPSWLAFESLNEVLSESLSQSLSDSPSAAAKLHITQGTGTAKWIVAP